MAWLYKYDYISYSTVIASFFIMFYFMANWGIFFYNFSNFSFVFTILHNTFVMILRLLVLQNYVIHEEYANCIKKYTWKNKGKKWCWGNVFVGVQTCTFVFLSIMHDSIKAIVLSCNYKQYNQLWIMEQIEVHVQLSYIILVFWFGL